MDIQHLLVKQVFEPHDLVVIAFLAVLEGLLSADNAIIMAITVRHLPEAQQKRALLYGLAGAFLFRLIAIIFARFVLQLWWLQAVGAVYLVALPIKHWLSLGGEEEKPGKLNLARSFWWTVLVVEFTDIAFALDSVLAAVSSIGEHPQKLWVVYTGAMLGVVLLRFAANLFIGLLKKFPALDHVAYVIVGWVGIKLAFMAANEFEEIMKVRRLSSPIPFDVPELPTAVFWCVLTLIATIGTMIAIRPRRMSHLK